MSLLSHNKWLIIIVLSVFSAVGCIRNSNNYERFADIPAEGWKYGDTLRFDLCQTDTVVSGSLTLHLRHTGTYPYRNLWLEVTTTDSLRSHSDTLNIALSDVFGKWYGRGVGTDFQLSTSIFDTLDVRPATSVIVRHIMRVDNLPGIEQVGIQFEEFEND